jgi:hypothetical protein
MKKAKKLTFIEQNLRIRNSDDLKTNTLRVLRWSKIILNKLSSSSDFPEKENLTNELSKMIDFMSYDVVEISNDLRNDVWDDVFYSMNPVDIKRFNNLNEFQHQITEGEFVSDINEFSEKEGEDEDLVNELIEFYEELNNDKSKLFFSLYDKDENECWDRVLGEIIYRRQLGHDELMLVNLVDDDIFG